jgi:2,3-bisphosphoglycerate-independent phosphoglycerate mutase
MSVKYREFWAKLQKFASSSQKKQKFKVAQYTRKRILVRFSIHLLCDQREPQPQSTAKIEKDTGLMSNKTPYALVILDGWGYSESTSGNAIHLAKTPFWDNLWQNHTHCLISGSGPAVGLPEGQMGNSEVGHMNLGAGRVIDQDFTRINSEIDNKAFFQNETLKQTSQLLAATGKALHIFGLLSPGGVHSHEDHIKAMVKLAFDNKVEKVYLHAFLDGRDVPPKSAKKSIDQMQNYMQSLGSGGIASLIGRYYAMDRDKRWDRIEAAYKLINEGKGLHQYQSPQEALEAAYQRGESDEFVEASAIAINKEQIQIRDGDAIVFMNFRADRARQITQSFISEDFAEFPRLEKPRLSRFVMLTQYSEDFDCFSAFSKPAISNTLGEFLANKGLTQLRIAETEKYAHVTFFFSGGREKEFDGESRILIPSPDVATYDLQPSMSAPELTSKLVKAIESKAFDVIICNFANGDMVGHTGNLAAAIEAVECIDMCLGRIISALKASNGHCLITADHGNVEQMNDNETGQAHTAHTSEKVPLIYFHQNATSSNKSGHVSLEAKGGALSDIAPTLIDIMDLTQPIEMTGHSLLLKNAE